MYTSEERPVCCGWKCFRKLFQSRVLKTEVHPLSSVPLTWINWLNFLLFLMAKIWEFPFPREEVIRQLKLRLFDETLSDSNLDAPSTSKELPVPQAEPEEATTTVSQHVDDLTSSFFVSKVDTALQKMLKRKEISNLISYLWNLPPRKSWKESETIHRSLAAIAHSYELYQDLMDLLRSFNFSPCYHRELQCMWNAAYWKDWEKLKGKKSCPWDKHKLKRKYPFPRTIWNGTEYPRRLPGIMRPMDIFEEIYEKCQHPDKEERMQLAEKTGIPLSKVSKWFRNRRYSEKGLAKRSLERAAATEVCARTCEYKPSGKSPELNAESLAEFLNCGAEEMDPTRHLEEMKEPSRTDSFPQGFPAAYDDIEFDKGDYFFEIDEAFDRYSRDTEFMNTVDQVLNSSERSSAENQRADCGEENCGEENDASEI